MHGHCDEKERIVNSNGDNAPKMNDKSAVNDSVTGDVNDNKENGVRKKTENSPEQTKINGDKSDILRTPSVATNDSVIKIGIDCSNLIHWRKSQPHFDSFVRQCLCLWKTK